MLKEREENEKRTGSRASQLVDFTGEWKQLFFCGMREGIDALNRDACGFIDVLIMSGFEYFYSKIKSGCITKVNEESKERRHKVIGFGGMFEYLFEGFIAYSITSYISIYFSVINEHS